MTLFYDADPMVQGVIFSVCPCIQPTTVDGSGKMAE